VSSRREAPRRSKLQKAWGVSRSHPTSPVVNVDLTDAETRVILNLITDAIEADRYPLSPRVQVRRDILIKFGEIGGLPADLAAKRDPSRPLSTQSSHPAQHQGDERLCRCNGTVAILRRLMNRVSRSQHQHNGRPDCRAVPRRKRFARTYRADRKKIRFSFLPIRFS